MAGMTKGKFGFLRGGGDQNLVLLTMPFSLLCVPKTPSAFDRLKESPNVGA